MTRTILIAIPLGAAFYFWAMRQLDKAVACISFIEDDRL